MWNSTQSDQIWCSIYLIWIFFFSMIAWTYPFTKKSYSSIMNLSRLCHKIKLLILSSEQSLGWSIEEMRIRWCIQEMDIQFRRISYRLIFDESFIDFRDPRTTSINLHYFLFQIHINEVNLISRFNIDIFDTIQIRKISDRFDTIYFHIRVWKICIDLENQNDNNLSKNYKYISRTQMVK